jgi:hypothetical protein
MNRTPPSRLPFTTATPFLAAIPAYPLRQDLLAAGKGNGRHGFSFQAPAALTGGKPHQVYSRTLAVGLSDWPVLFGQAPP